MKVRNLLLLAFFTVFFFNQTALCQTQNQHFKESNKEAGRVLYLTGSDRAFADDLKEIYSYLQDQYKLGKRPNEIMMFKPEIIQDYTNHLGERQTCSKMVVHFIYIWYYPTGFSVVFGNTEIAPDGLGQSITCQRFFEYCSTDM